MNISLRAVTRENWEEALELKVSQSQSHFVPSVAISLAKVHIKPDGNDVVYIPFAIYHDNTMVGFIMHAYQEETSNMYWINGFLIDEQYQHKGYGKVALTEMIDWIQNRFNKCEEIRLTVFRDNVIASSLYRKVGFLPTDIVYGEEDVWRLPLQKEE